MDILPRFENMISATNSIPSITDLHRNEAKVLVNEITTQIILRASSPSSFTSEEICRSRISNLKKLQRKTRKLLTSDRLNQELTQHGSTVNRDFMFMINASDYARNFCNTNDWFLVHYKNDDFIVYGNYRARELVTYNNGDITLITSPSDKSFDAEILDMYLSFKVRSIH